MVKTFFGSCSSRWICKPRRTRGFETSLQRANFGTSRIARTEDLDTHKPLRTTLTGRALLNAPSFNKGTAFNASERQAFGLEGLLPSGVQTLDEQVHRAYQQYCALSSDLLRNSFMTSMCVDTCRSFKSLIG